MRKNLWAALLLALCLTGLTGCDAISVKIGRAHV